MSANATHGHSLYSCTDYTSSACGLGYSGGGSRAGIAGCNTTGPNGLGYYSTDRAGHTIVQNTSVEHTHTYTGGIETKPTNLTVKIWVRID